MDTRIEEYRVPTFPNGDSLEMIANELQRGIDNIKAGNSRAAKALLEVLHGRILKTSAAYAAGVQAERERTSGWIPCSERLPEPFEYVLTWNGAVVLKGRRQTGVNALGHWMLLYIDGGNVDTENTVTHWMPLPPPPSTTPNDQTTQQSTT